MRDKIFIQNEVGREMGRGVEAPDNAKKVYEEKLGVYTGITGCVCWSDDGDMHDA